MKKFIFRYSPLVWVLLIVVTLVFAAAVAANVYTAITLPAENVTRKAFAVLIATLSFALLAITVSVTVYGRYVIKGKYLYCRFGFFYVKTDINSIFQLTEFKAQKKLVAYFAEEKYSVIVIAEKDYRNFYKALKVVNPQIIYTVNAAEE